MFSDRVVEDIEGLSSDSPPEGIFLAAIFNLFADAPGPLLTLPLIRGQLTTGHGTQVSLQLGRGQVYHPDYLSHNNQVNAYSSLRGVGCSEAQF